LNKIDIIVQILSSFRRGAAWAGIQILHCRYDRQVTAGKKGSDEIQKKSTAASLKRLHVLSWSQTVSTLKVSGKMTLI